MTTPASAPAPTVPPPAPTRLAPVLVALGLGTAVAVTLGGYGRLHTPTGQALNLAGFSTGLAAKAWLTTLALVLALVQLVTASALYGRLPWRGAWVGVTHRWSGRAAVLVTVPVAVHCLYALGFAGDSPRVLLHSLFGCFFYGAFVAKMLVLSRADTPGWALPALGGAAFTAVTALWLTASLWFFTTFGLTR